MDFKKIPALYWLLLLALLILAFTSGRFIKDYPYLELETKISIIDVLDALITVALAIFIPIFIRNFIERRDKINDVVFDSLNDYKKELENLQFRFSSFYKAGAISEVNKTELYVYSEILEKKLESLKRIYKEICGEKSNELLSSLTEHHIELWRIITGETINENSYNKIDEVLFTNEIKAYQAITDCITELNLYLIRK